MPSPLPFLFFGRAENGMFTAPKLTCFVWLRAPIAALTPAAKRALPKPLRKFIHVDGRLLVIGSPREHYMRDSSIQLLVRKHYAKPSEGVGTIRSKLVPKEHRDFVAGFMRELSKPSVWDRFFTDLEEFLLALHAEAPIEAAVVDWLDAHDYGVWHHRSVAECDHAYLRSIATMPVSTDGNDQARALMRTFVSAQLYFLADNRSFYTTLADDTALQTLFGRLTGAAGALTLQLMAGAVSDLTFAAIVERSLNPKWVAARGIVGDYTNVLAAPTTGGWAIAYKQNVFYLREPIALEASLPEWGITITDGAHLPFDIATAFGELYERLIVGGRAPSSDAERAFVTECRRNVVRVM